MCIVAICQRLFSFLNKYYGYMDMDHQEKKQDKLR